MRLLRLANYEIVLRNGKGLLPTRLSCSVYLTVNLNLIIFLRRIASQIPCIQNQNFLLLSRKLLNEINDFLVKKVIEQSQPETGEIVSPIFLRPKKEPGVYRVIFNLKSLNQAVTYHKFKMDMLESAIRLMKPGCFMSSIDLHNGYYSIPISPSFRKYLKFAWRGFLFQFCALPMGLTSSTRIFTKMLKPVFATLRSQYGHNCLGYVDDSFYSVEDCCEATLHATQLFTCLRFVIHPTKSVFHPTQCLEEGRQDRCFVSESFACPGIINP